MKMKIGNEFSLGDDTYRVVKIQDVGLKRPALHRALIDGDKEPRIYYGIRVNQGGKIQADQYGMFSHSTNGYMERM